ncbi:PEP-CTERM sorting domain-containing protein [Aestuariicella hydrocarbonica]|uniref:PEP-CTERM sorting domain-containing protein n=1 Tax=Pseudomaricurvus hydrocarbonicus TaxID=1470433 RepID=A0A9E5MKM5_9GAMM|nr:PEP-CTERM sorting domain-containing protein [Aestuariicella hydrocarbonica]NHO66759.1 PEP-CTERM sorting domain-containing protein [Aestuariicella hydrocarbonica]
MSDFQSGYIDAQINEQGVVSITSFSLVLAKGDLSSEGHYYLDIGSNFMALDYCLDDSTGTCSPEFTCWGRPFGIPLSVVSREAPLSDVPEPMTLSILLLGLLGIFASRKICKPEDAKVMMA